MVKISKLTKNEIKQTGFNNRSIAAKFMKTVLNKKARDFKKKEDLINTLKKEYNKMKNFGIDLNENAQAERKLKKIEKTIKTGYKQKEEFEKYLIKNMNDEAVLEMHINDYLKDIDYKIPSNQNYTNEKKPLKHKYYYKWQGMENVLQTITDLYRKQDTVLKFNMSMAYLLKRILYKRDEHGEIETNEKGDLIILGYEYKYFSAQYNNRLFEYPQTIDNNKTLNEILKKVEKKLKEQSWFERPSTEWKFVRYLHYEIAIFRLESTIGYAVSLPLHFYWLRC